MLGLGRLAGTAINAGQRRPLPGLIAVNPALRFGVSQRILEHSLLIIGPPDKAGAREVWIQFTHRLELFYCAVILAGEVEDCTVVRRNDQRKGIQVTGDLAFAECFIEPASPSQIFREPMVGSSVVGIQFDGSPILLLSRLPIPIVVFGYQSQGSMGLRQAVVE